MKAGWRWKCLQPIGCQLFNTKKVKVIKKTSIKNRAVRLKFIILIVAIGSRPTDVECPRRGQTWLAPRKAQPKRGVEMVPMTWIPASKRANLDGVLVFTGSPSSRPTDQVKPPDSKPQVASLRSLPRANHVAPLRGAYSLRALISNRTGRMFSLRKESPLTTTSDNSRQYLTILFCLSLSRIVLDCLHKINGKLMGIDEN